MIDKSHNTTRYNTDDINNILSAIEESERVFFTTDWNKQTVQRELRVDTDDFNGVASASPKILEAPQAGRWSRRRSRRGNRLVGNYTAVGGSMLFIMPPRHLAEIPEMGLSMIADAATGEALLPYKVKLELIENIFAKMQSTTLSKEGLELSRKHAMEIANANLIRVMPSVEAGPSGRVPLTQAEKIERLQSDSFYGEGGVLYGPRWGYSRGDRAATFQWTDRIRRACNYYLTERDARERHGKKLRDLGVEPVPYETFSQYLRRIADEYEREGK